MVVKFMPRSKNSYPFWLKWISFKTGVMKKNKMTIIRINKNIHKACLVADASKLLMSFGFYLFIYDELTKFLLGSDTLPDIKTILNQK